MHFDIDIDGFHSYIQSFCYVTQIPESEASFVATAFLADFFELVGEAQPGAVEIHYNQMSYREIFNEYMVRMHANLTCLTFANPFPPSLLPHLHEDDQFVKQMKSDLVSLPHFCWLIRNVFPKVRSREFKSVPGKCDPCESLRAKMKVCTLRSDRTILKFYKLLHRNMYMGEKLKYYERINEAASSNGRVWSFIFDAMSKHKTRLPILSNTAHVIASTLPNTASFNPIFHPISTSHPCPLSSADDVMGCVMGAASSSSSSPSSSSPSRPFLPVSASAEFLK